MIGTLNPKLVMMVKKEKGRRGKAGGGEARTGGGREEKGRRGREERESLLGFG